MKYVEEIVVMLGAVWIIVCVVLIIPDIVLSYYLGH